MGAPYGSLAEGLFEGYKVGSQIEQEKKELELKNKIFSLQQIREQQNAEIERQKAEMAKQTQELTNSMTLGNKFFEGLKNISNPMAKQEYLKNIDQMPWYKNASSEVKSAFSGMAKSGVGDVDTFMKLYSGFQKSFDEGDQNGMASSLLGMNAIFGADPSMKPLLEQANKLAGIKMPTQKESDIGTYLRESKNYAPGSKESQIYEKALLKESTPTPGVTINTGNMTKPTQTMLEKNLYSSQNQISELKNIQQKFDSTMLEIPSLFKTNVSNIKSKLGIRLDPQKQKELDNFIDNTVSAARITNQHIHDISGGQVTKNEMERNFVQLPIINAETFGRFFKNHSPAEFKKILDNNIKYSIRAAARADYALKNGKIVTDDNGETIAFLDNNGKSLSLDDKRFDQQTAPQNGNDFVSKASEIAMELKRNNPNMTDEEIETETLKQLGIE